MPSKTVCDSSASGFGASAARPFPVKSSSYAEPSSDGGFCCSESEMESGGVKAPSDKGTSARAVPSRCRRWADMFGLLDGMYSYELGELEGMDGLVLVLIISFFCLQSRHCCGRRCSASDSVLERAVGVLAWNGVGMLRRVMLGS